MTLKLDHLVINNHFALDDCALWFRALGFTLTPRGYHSLGSINHLIMFSDHYLELIGLPVGGEKLRRELLDNPPGIDGLVFASTDAQATEHALQRAGFDAHPVQHFSREVVSGDARGDARFSTVRLVPGSFSAGRVYFCQHHTPEWVWREEWLQPGGISGLTVVAHDVPATGKRYAQLGETDLLKIISYDDWQAQYGALLPLNAELDSQFAAIQLYGQPLPALSAAATRLGLPQATHNGQLRVAIPTLNLLLEFDNVR
ncbi:hypothetical protein PEC302107_16340 [Pectobacterium araliae]|uniref:Glyoxalase-like domain-containing protein n=1 Tax=Pectobacterium araliae TaxID=3073862 RepID=A0AAN0MMC6_9GAMM|nr:hypothetical protein PEC302110_25200 [Pectobacterium sp. MAFF 302110]GKW19905.1 hypothetical protein PEC302107_16340 [Pectobacterium carotovorum subsp. carotovorum]